MDNYTIVFLRSCFEGWTGEDCSCPTSTAGCRHEWAGAELCSGRGSCECNQCQCEAGSSGRFCQQDANIQPATREANTCARIEPCILHDIYGYENNTEVTEEIKVRYSLFDHNLFTTFAARMNGKKAARMLRDSAAS